MKKLVFAAVAALALTGYARPQLPEGMDGKAGVFSPVTPTTGLRS